MPTTAHTPIPIKYYRRLYPSLLYRDYVLVNDKRGIKTGRFYRNLNNGCEVYIGNSAYATFYPKSSVTLLARPARATCLSDF